jgi:hypothetical protein
LRKKGPYGAAGTTYCAQYLVGIFCACAKQSAAKVGIQLEK